MNEYFAFQTVIFDLDSMVTKTANLHTHSWKAVFDDYLKLREKRNGEPFQQFTYRHDYLIYVDGKPRYKGVQSFLASRNIQLPLGNPSDSPDRETVCGINNKKNILFDNLLQKECAEVFTTTITLIEDLKKHGIRVGAVSSSKDCHNVLKSIHLEHLFETIVDRIVSQKLNLKRKPEGDILVAAAKNLGSLPESSAVVGDTSSGVEAGRNGGFGLVLGVARENNKKALFQHGADLVVSDLAEISIGSINNWFLRKPKPYFLCFENLKRAPLIFPPEHLKEKKISINPFYRRTGKAILTTGKKLTFFLDYDGTLTPIAESPELAILTPYMKKTVEILAEIHTVAIVSGRLREDVQNLVGIKGIFYVGSHGFDIEGPGGFSMVHQDAKKTIPLISHIIKQLKMILKEINGVLIEEKKFSVAVHYRKVKSLTDLQFITEAIQNLVQKYGGLRILKGKKVFEILPNIDWDKGKAIRWIMNALNIPWESTEAFYLGDDTTDEYAFRTVITRGTAILISDDPERASSADFLLQSPEEVKKFFEQVLAFSEKC